MTQNQTAEIKDCTPTKTGCVDERYRDVMQYKIHVAHHNFVKVSVICPLAEGVVIRKRNFEHCNVSICIVCSLNPQPAHSELVSKIHLNIGS